MADATAHGIFSPGSALVAGSTGTLTIGGGLSLNQESLLLFDLGTASDQVAVTVVGLRTAADESVTLRGGEPDDEVELWLEIPRQVPA